MCVSPMCMLCLIGHRAACIFSICVLRDDADPAQINPGTFFDPLAEQLSWVQVCSLRLWLLRKLKRRALQ